MKQLRDYQEVACDYISKRLNNYKRPFIYTLACGCFTGDTKVRVNLSGNGRQVSIKTLYKNWNGLGTNPEYNIRNKDRAYVRGWRNGKVGLNKIQDVICLGKKKIVRLEFSDGTVIRTTPDHKFLAKRSSQDRLEPEWVEAKDLAGMMVAKDNPHSKRLGKKKKLADKRLCVPREHPFARKQKHQNGSCSYIIELHRAIYEANLNGFEDVYDWRDHIGKIDMEFIDPSKYHIHHKDHDHSNNEPSNLECLTVEEHREHHSTGAESHFHQGEVEYIKCVEVEECGEETVYDIVCADVHSYTANDFVVHNCGKSLVIAELAKRHGKVLVLTLSAELCKQDYDECVEYGVEARIYSASMKTKEVGDITIATIGSAYKNPYLFTDADLVIIDEVQSVNPAEPKSMFMKLLIEMNKIKRDSGGGGIKILGLTATPYRNVQRTIPHGTWYETTTMLQPLNRIPCGRGFLWSSIVEGINTKQALERGYLTPVEYYSNPTSGNLVVNSTGAEFTDESLDEWGGGVIAKCANLMKQEDSQVRSGIVALPFVRHAEALKVMCDSLGLSTVVVSSQTPTKERTESIRAFKAGEIKWLLQCNIANVGFNSPITDTLIWARPTLSLNLWQQAVGRVMRLCQGKVRSRVFDLVGTLDTFGCVEDVKLGVEDKFKTTIEGTKGKLSGIPLRTFYWSRSINNRDSI